MDISFEHKLIILYFLSSINSSINMSEITTFLVEKNYTDYMHATAYLSELAESKLINSYQKDNKVLYKINDEGKSTLEIFGDSLNKDNIKIIDDYLLDLKDLSTNSLHSSFNYEKQEDNNYNVTCSIAKDKNILFNISIPNVKEKEIKKIETKWDSNKLTIMKNIKENLM